MVVRLLGYIYYNIPHYTTHNGKAIYSQSVGERHRLNGLLLPLGGGTRAGTGYDSINKPTRSTPLQAPLSQRVTGQGSPAGLRSC